LARKAPRRKYKQRSKGKGPNKKKLLEMPPRMIPTTKTNMKTRGQRKKRKIPQKPRANKVKDRSRIHQGQKLR